MSGDACEIFPDDDVLKCLNVPPAYPPLPRLGQLGDLGLLPEPAQLLADGSVSLDESQEYAWDDSGLVMESR